MKSNGLLNSLNSKKSLDEPSKFYEEIDGLFFE